MNPSLLNGSSGSSAVDHVGSDEGAKRGPIIFVAGVLAATAERPEVRVSLLKMDMEGARHPAITAVERATRLETTLTDPTQHPRFAWSLPTLPLDVP